MSEELPNLSRIVNDNRIFPRKSDFGHKCGVLKSELLGTFVSIDKSAPSGADGC